MRQDQLIENGDPKPWTREFRTRLSFHVDDGATGVRDVTAEPVSGHVSHPVVVRGQEDETSVLHVSVQETPQFRQVRHVRHDTEIVSNVLAFPDTDVGADERVCSVWEADAVEIVAETVLNALRRPHQGGPGFGEHDGQRVPADPAWQQSGVEFTET